MSIFPFFLSSNIRYGYSGFSEVAVIGSGSQRLACQLHLRVNSLSVGLRNFAGGVKMADVILLKHGVSGGTKHIDS